MSRNPFMEREAAEGKNTHGKKYERKGAASLAAQLTMASGALVGNKGDARKRSKAHGKQGFLIEMKSTTALSLAVKMEWLVKISQEATAKGEHPALVMAFVTPEGRPIPHAPAEWVAVPMHVWKELTEE